jgi:K+-sensing histidine kinase KdpD
MKDQEVELGLEIEDENLQVEGESYLLVSCLVNLLRNAVLHTHPGGEILLGTSRENQKFFCTVIDQGKNYDEELMEKLSKQFVEGNRNLNLNLGIDLGLAQMIMEAHKGCIQFQATGDNRGSVSMIFKKSTEGDE